MVDESSDSLNIPPSSLSGQVKSMFQNISSWKHSPIYVRQFSLCDSSEPALVDGYDGRGVEPLAVPELGVECEINNPLFDIPINNDFFYGKAYILIANLPTSPTEYFK